MVREYSLSEDSKLEFPATSTISNADTRLVTELIEKMLDKVPTQRPRASDIKRELRASIPIAQPGIYFILFMLSNF